MRMRSRPSPTDENRRPGFQFFSRFQPLSRARTMGLRHAYLDLLIAATLVASAAAIPTSLVDEIKSSEIRNSKVKRAHPVHLANSGENEGQIPYYNQPSAIKRGVNIDLKSLPDPEWEQEQADFIYRNTLPNISSSLFQNSDSNFDDDKTIAEYEKGFRYGTNKEKLDEALENAVLKSELYGEPASINQYRYFGAEAARKRKRRDAKKLRLESRIKRDVELSPEEILALLSLYEDNRPRQPHQSSDNYRYPWNRFEPNLEMDINQDDSRDQEEGNWLDNPVYPHASSYEKNLGSKYMKGPQVFENKGGFGGLGGEIDLGPRYMNEPVGPQLFENKERWRGLGEDNRNKKFMVAKKRNVDPTHELRYINGPNKNDFYTLSQLLSNQREPNLPVYHRLIL